MNNSAGKITLKENLFSRQYSVALINLIVARFIITMKHQATQNRNEKKKKDLILVISIISMHGIEHISYHTKHFFSECLKYVAKFSLKDSITQEFRYIYLGKLVNSEVNLTR